MEQIITTPLAIDANVTTTPAKYRHHALQGENQDLGAVTKALRKLFGKSRLSFENQRRRMGNSLKI